MRGFIKSNAIAAMVAVCGVTAHAQGVPAGFGSLQQNAEMIAELERILEIMENPDLQDDPAVQAEIEQMRDVLAPNALSASEANELYFKIINAEGNDQ